MPDKNDAKYKERYEKEKHYGEVFAEKAGLNWLAKKVQLWANNNRKMFLFLAFGFVIFIFLLNILTVSKAYRNRKAHKTNSRGTCGQGNEGTTEPEKKISYGFQEDKIFKAPKYALPAILYFPILFLGYFTIDLFQGSSRAMTAWERR